LRFSKNSLSTTVRKRDSSSRGEKISNSISFPKFKGGKKRRMTYRPDAKSTHQMKGGGRKRVANGFVFKRFLKWGDGLSVCVKRCLKGKLP